MCRFLLPYFITGNSLIMSSHTLCNNNNNNNNNMTMTITIVVNNFNTNILFLSATGYFD